MKLTDAITKGLTGRRAQKTTTKSALEAGKKAFGNFWKNVAHETGVSERTLRRVRAGGKTSKATQRKLDDFAKRQEVRRASVKPRRASKIQSATQSGARVKFTAWQGPIGRGAGDYRRQRTMDFNIPGEAMQELNEAYESGDDEAIQSLMEQYTAEFGWTDWSPQGGWTIGETDEWDFDPN